MNENERIIEVDGYSEPVRIYWHKDPTRHLLKEKAVNARVNSERSAAPAKSKTAPGDDGDDPANTRALAPK